MTETVRKSNEGWLTHVPRLYLQSVTLWPRRSCDVFVKNAAVELKRSVMAWWISAHLLVGCSCCETFYVFWWAKSLSFRPLAVPLLRTHLPDQEEDIKSIGTRSPLHSALPLKYRWRWSFFLFFSFFKHRHFLSSRPFLCFRFSHYRAAVMFLCSSTTLPPQKLIVWNYAVGCKSLLVHCNWLLLHWQWQLFLLSFTRHAVC